MESERTALSVNGVQIRLSEERWQHIVERHPELEGRQEAILEAVRNPDHVQRGDFGTLVAVKGADGLYLVVVYREINLEDGFVVTAYHARRLRRRVMIWKR